MKLTWYNGRDIFFYITSGRINTWKGVNQLKEPFLFNLIVLFLNTYLKLTNLRYFLLKTHYFSQFITKIGFCCKILSLNDLTPSPISRPGTHCLQQRANARANLWWRHEPFPGETSIALRSCAGKAGVAKRYQCDAWVPFHPTDVVNLVWLVRFWKKFTLNRTQDVVLKPLVYSVHCSACWSQGSHSNSAREISRAIFARGGVGRYVVLSVCYTKLS